MKILTTTRVMALAFAVSLVSSIDARAGSESWAEVTDVAQYVPLGFALAETAYQEDLEGLVQLTLAGALTLGTTELLKNEIDAKRPNYKPGDGQNSFPSGHVAKAWFAAAHVQKRYGCYKLEWQCWRGSAIPYLAAGVTAYGRVAADRHHWEDVLASAVIAETFVYFTTDKYDPDLSVSANFENGFGIFVSKRF
eukprot:s1_g1526.t1